MKQVVKWIAGIILTLAAFGALASSSYVSFLFFGIGAFLCIPPLMKMIEDKFFNGNVKSIFKYVGVIASFLIGSSTLNTPNTLDYQNSSTSEIGSRNSAVDSILNVRRQEKDRLIASSDSLAKAHSLKSSKDEFKPDVTFYHPTNAPKYRNISWMYPYLVKSGNYMKMRYVIQYEADDWLFINNVKVKITYEGGNEKVIDLYSGRFDRDNGNGKIWEWVDTNVSDSMYSKLLDINNAKKAKIRFEGDKYYKERNMTSKELRALKNVIDVYKQVRK